MPSLRFFSPYNWDNREPLFVPGGFCHADSRSLEASRSRVGIAEWDDTGQLRCIFFVSRKGPVCAEREENGRCANVAATQPLAQSGSDSESVRSRRSLATDLFTCPFRSRPGVIYLA
jgi:hypothetical protein